MSSPLLQAVEFLTFLASSPDLVRNRQPLHRGGVSLFGNPPTVQLRIKRARGYMRGTPTTNHRGPPCVPHQACPRAASCPTGHRSVRVMNGVGAASVPALRQPLIRAMLPGMPGMPGLTHYLADRPALSSLVRCGEPRSPLEAYKKWNLDEMRSPHPPSTPWRPQS